MAKDESVKQEDFEKFREETREEFRNLKENHLAHIQRNLNEEKVSNALMRNDIAWLKKFFWALAGPVIAGLAVGIINLLIK